MDEKKYRSHRKRLELLRNRRMSIPINSSKERNIIKKYNYYTLVNGYKDPFLVNRRDYPADYPQNEDLYIRGTNPSHLEALLNCDNNLSNIFLKRLLFIEEEIKNAIVESFYDYYSKNLTSKHKKDNLHRENEYLRRDYYDLNNNKKKIIMYKSGKTKIFDSEFSDIPSDKPIKNCKTREIKRVNQYEEFVSNVYGTISRQRNKKQSLKYYLDNHRYIPMWVLVQVLTFGNISKMFDIQIFEVRKQIVNILNLNSVNLNLNENFHTISNIFNILNIYRNISAHGERLFCTSTKIEIDDDYQKFSLLLPGYDRVERCHERNVELYAREFTTLQRRRNGLFKLIFCISLFLKKTELKKLVKEIKKELKDLKSVLKSTSYNNVLFMMGLDFDWEESLLNR